ncbi:UDPglucose--hexose-1-phosphate uridylyltransferase [Jatrophihabitans endophyticus]|uniref:Galactose-1-phosphate uridylyltransferase n=1 Tax=Jatrophihabitans endophyticus TaxID=1206085 RepID=A0A1M5DLG5_9ACTN|nr:galactose-1-phosphate uridylyltransferase [Jatrophihabitans endophyticus]SHF67741.1 UDPglucose--hexose-1-phosphate uridylyltransferase [Jatrophihabitans endophyticus]
MTSTRLADGRELRYYDAAPTPHPEHDQRDLPAIRVASEARFDPLLGEWVVQASHRQDRTFQPPADQCPLCPSTAERATEIPAPRYEVAVFENRFPSLAQDVADVAPLVDGEPLFERRPGVGRCEVVCFSDDHDASFGDLSAERVRLVVDVWAERTAALGALDGVEQVFAFENRGIEIGVTLSHPHGQLYGYPFVTPRTGRMLDRARGHHERTGGNLFADVLAAERDAGTRVIATNGTWTAFVPAAARWPVEVHLYPHRRFADLGEATDAERDDFATLYLDVLRRVDALYDVAMPYIAAWNQAPVHTGRDLAYTHLELFSIRRAPGKLKYLAGSESGMGVFVNDVTPESVAARLREL